MREWIMRLPWYDSPTAWLGWCRAATSLLSLSKHRGSRSVYGCHVPFVPAITLKSVHISTKFRVMDTFGTFRVRIRWKPFLFRWISSCNHFWSSFRKTEKVSILGGIYQIFPLSAEYRRVFFGTIYRFQNFNWLNLLSIFTHYAVTSR